MARIVWHYSASDEPRTFQITYRVRGLTRVHRDAVDVFWQVWGDGWKGSLDRLDATLTLPPNVPAGSERIWGHPGSVPGTVARQGRKVVLAATNIPREQFVELRTLLPRSALGAQTPGARVDDDVAFDRIVSQEQADFASAASDYRKLQRVLDNRPLVALAVVLAGLAAAIIFYGLAFLRYGREPEGSDGAITYVPEPPDDAPPAVALALTNQGDPGPGDDDALAATLLDLIVRGRFKTRVVDDEKGRPDLLLEEGETSLELAKHEQPVVAIIESVLTADEPVPLGQLGKRLKALSDSKRTTERVPEVELRQPARPADPRRAAAVQATGHPRRLARAGGDRVRDLRGADGRGRGQVHGARDLGRAGAAADRRRDRDLRGADRAVAALAVGGDPRRGDPADRAVDRLPALPRGAAAAR